jgi:purine-nucleoside phosphorylase
MKRMIDKTPTPHIGAKLGDIAETVIMAGDPLRVKFMAENFLDNPVQFNNVRGMLGFTGSYKGKRVSVMGHGMGMPSIGIYTYELYNFYGVKTIIRVGSAGSIQHDLHVGDLVVAMGACTNSNYASQYELPGTFAPIADFSLVRKAVETCERLGYHYKVGNVFSSDVFYGENPHNDKWINMGVLAVEMEIAGLYMNAARSGNRALGICTISDHILTGEVTTAEERQTTFTHMMDVAFSLID